MLAPPHPDETHRVATLHALSILDTPKEQAFDDIADFAARICETPIALISFVDSDRQWFKSSRGADGITETSRRESICAHAINEGDYLEIEDTTRDNRTVDNGLVLPTDGVRFYAGAVLKTSDGVPIGSVCVLDYKPRRLTTAQRETLLFLSKQVMAQVELRRALETEADLRGEIDHRVKNSLQTVASILRVQRSSLHSDEAREALSAAERRIKTISLLHNELYSTENYQSLELSEFIKRLCDLLRVTLPDNMRLVTATDRVEVASGKAKAIAMITGEFVANSSKHAFDPDQSGTITVKGQMQADGYELMLYDNGRGLPPGASAGQGLGTRIIAASVDQLGGEMDYRDPPEGETGACVRIVFQP